MLVKSRGDSLHVLLFLVEAVLVELLADRLHQLGHTRPVLLLHENIREDKLL